MDSKDTSKPEDTKRDTSLLRGDNDRKNPTEKSRKSCSNDESDDDMGHERKHSKRKRKKHKKRKRDYSSSSDSDGSSSSSDDSSGRRRKDRKKRKSKKHKRKRKHDDDTSSDRDQVRRSVITGKKIKMSIDKTQEDRAQDAARQQLLEFMNSSYK